MFPPLQGPSKWNFALLSAGKAPQWSEQFALTILLLRSWPHRFLVSSDLKTWKCRPLSRLTLHQKVRNEVKPCFPSPSVNRGSALIWFYIIPAALQLFLLCLLIVSSHYVNWHPPLPSRICVNFRQSGTRSFFSFLIIVCLCFVSCSRSWCGTVTQHSNWRNCNNHLLLSRSCENKLTALHLRHLLLLVVYLFFFVSHQITATHASVCA